MKKIIFVVTRQAFSVGRTTSPLSFPILDEDPCIGVFTSLSEAKEVVKAALDFDRRYVTGYKAPIHKCRNGVDTLHYWNEDEKKRMSLLFTIKEFEV